MAEAWVDWLIRAIIIGVVIVACVVDLTHNRKPPFKYPMKYIIIRFLNWLTVGMTYACTYFGRYNMSLLNTSDVHSVLGVTTAQFGIIITTAYVIYGVFVAFNGVLVDRLGGKKATIIGSMGSSVMNIVMGFWMLNTKSKGTMNIVFLAVFYAINDFFQTFCTTAICKVGVNWYHISERGFFGGIFGIIISFGFFLALQVNANIKAEMHFSAVFFIPGAILAVMTVLCVFFVKSTPEDAGWPPVDEEALEEYNERKKLLENQEENAGGNSNRSNSDGTETTDNGTASSNSDDIDHYETESNNNQKKSVLYPADNANSLKSPAESKGNNGANKRGSAPPGHYGMGLKELVKRVCLNPVFLILCVIDFCVGWCRDGVINYNAKYFQEVWGAKEDSLLYLISSTGVTLGSMFGSLGAGIVSDVCCGSRRPPVAFVALVLYSGCILIVLFAVSAWMGAVGIGLTAFCFSCVHGIITSTCAMDFAGPRATATAVGLLDGIQKIGSSMTGVVMGRLWDLYGSKGWIFSLLPGSGLGALLMLPIIGKKGGKPTKNNKKNKEKVKEIEVGNRDDSIKGRRNQKMSDMGPNNSEEYVDDDGGEVELNGVDLSY
ncbi:putative glycerol 3-phosphate permease [Monocercomonoides exilis]|uniref:putative glycerol 3-phosphate permease n=1 Tax=Monocercomonoides exilis TaxID=2049356 RepID=UPI003559CCCC|nr:putative glycerol 3-phosphate permease [Monocercomonoides exilis]|eukprot:MONOS_2700.1-p1 / transcript=MONOS_2700.1 / gene=MONOS_2700 / organism=Monocercomonoides_exilis_PA203 / gene_product=glycerol 3-phosphate permease / transcript_product=glycerol 3-phosphate permease / location=Mono_scaffold00057:21205-23286(-) / protein_length=603 / sequence_SO=supercontig / SO=protein_coding / is_pseudo=false